MEWLLFALLCSFFNALQQVSTRRTLRHVDQYVVVLSYFLFSMPFLWFSLWFVGVPSLKPGFWSACLWSIAINLVAFTLYIKALQLSSLALTVPFLAFTPLFLLPVAYVLRGERAGPQGWLGIMLIVLGAYVLNIKHRRRGWLAPFRAILKERGSVLMLIVAGLWSFSATIEKTAVLASSPVFYPAVFSLVFPFLYGPIALWGSRTPVRTLKRRLHELVALGFLEGVMSIFQMMALQMSLVVYVIAVKRSGMVFAVLIGAVFLGEKEWREHLVGSLMMAAGVVLISLS